jgi:mannose-6-phosphate isomerase-like protein (cupin superfamily)
MKSTVTFSEGFIPSGKGKPVQLSSGVLRRLIHPELAVKSKNVALSLLVMNPGDEVAPHFHKEREEIYFVLSGEGVAIHKDGDDIEEIKYVKDLSIHIPPNVVHDIKVVGNEPLALLVIMAPPLPIDDAHKA